MTKRVLKIAGIVVLVVVVLAGAFTAWLVFGKPSDLKTKAYRALPFPAVMVGGKTVLAKDYVHRVDIAKKTLPADSGVSDQEIKQQVYDRLVDERKAEILAGQKGLEVSNNEIEDQYQDNIKQLTGGNESDFKKMLDQYGLTEPEFKGQVLKPDLVFTKLVIWYNSQRDMNAAAYQQVDAITERLKDASTTFETLAAEYAQKQMGEPGAGDLGFVELEKLLPEFKNSLRDAKPGETKVVASRYGIHYFKIENVDSQGENGSQRVQLKQIVLEPQGFDQWYKSATKDFSVRRFIKI